MTSPLTRYRIMATVVGVLVEVPVMLTVVHIVRRTRGWYEAPVGG